MEYSFHFYNTMAETGLMMALTKSVKESAAPPVFLCVGSDLAIGDSLGPVVGTLLKRRGDVYGFIYGTLKVPITAKEVKYVDSFLRKTHPGSKIIAIDAAVGEESDVGLLKVVDSPLKPGAGANKRLGKVGDVSLLGIVGKRSAFSYSMLSLTRLNVVYSMAETLSAAIAAFSQQLYENTGSVCFSQISGTK